MKALRRDLLQHSPALRCPVHPLGGAADVRRVPNRIKGDPQVAQLVRRDAEDRGRGTRREAKTDIGRGAGGQMRLRVRPGDEQRAVRPDQIHAAVGQDPIRPRRRSVRPHHCAREARFPFSVHAPAWQPARAERAAAENRRLLLVPRLAPGKPDGRAVARGFRVGDPDRDAGPLLARGDGRAERVEAVV